MYLVMAAILKFRTFFHHTHIEDIEQKYVIRHFVKATIMNLLRHCLFIIIIAK